MKWSVDAPYNSPELEEIDAELRRVTMRLSLCEAQIMFLHQQRDEELARIQNARAEAGEDK